jgi:predicted transglutaminase-like cysteine proteinase
MKALLIALAALATGCSVIPNMSVHDEALRNFIYVSDEENELFVYDRIDQPFMGDCEDYAFTLQRQIGGEVWHVIVEGGHHAVLVNDGWVYDNLSKWPVPRAEYQAVWVWVMG